MPHAKFPNLPAVHELLIEDGQEYPTPPEGIRVYKNGAGYSHEYTCMVYGPGTFAPNSTGIVSSERANELVRRRQEKAEEEVRNSIAEQTGVPVEVAFGNAAGILWKDIVLNSDQPGRTRVDVMRELGKRAGIVPDRDKVYAEKQGASIKVEGLTPAIAEQLKELVIALRPQSQAVEDEPQPTVDSSFVEHQEQDLENVDY